MCVCTRVQVCKQCENVYVLVCKRIGVYVYAWLTVLVCVCVLMHKRVCVCASLITTPLQNYFCFQEYSHVLVEDSWGVKQQEPLWQSSLAPLFAHRFHS